MPSSELIFRDDPYRRSCQATVTSADERGIRLDRTVFYPTGGGQPGDTGRLRLGDDSEVAIVDTVKGVGPEDVVHMAAEGALAPEPGTQVSAEIDWERRYRLMQMHTCLHLLSALLPYPVTGGSVGEMRSRLDFDIPDMSPDKEQITQALNRLIGEDHPVQPRWITEAELDAQPELIKTMSVKPPRGHGRVRVIEIPGLDLQPCGGTHVARTGEIAPVAVTKIQSKGRHYRRVVVAFAD
ncbi:MAG: alanyl-tRNA editing protein [Kiloniellales bacterium]